MHVLLRGIRLRGMADLVRTRDDHMVAKVARLVAGDADRREVERANHARRQDGNRRLARISFPQDLYYGTQ